MNLKNIIEAWKEDYNKEKEKDIISFIKDLKLTSLTGDIADLLGLAVSDHYNNLAKVILEKDYAGNQVDLNKLNQSLINQSDTKYSLLHFTAQFGNKEMLIYFLDNGVEISSDKDLMTPLHALCFTTNLTKKDWLKTIAKFESISPNIINQKDIYNLTPLHYAAHKENQIALEALIKSGAKK
ncbi:MAG: ankyrin repeat domain-containing protein [Rickettsiales bacterium]|jgi:ankyrin repeat protein|nr:ankyrin repeat domain-containing protein [Rickettsiales bacterium]